LALHPTAVRKVCFRGPTGKLVLVLRFTVPDPSEAWAAYFCCDAQQRESVQRCGRVWASPLGEPMKRRQFITLLGGAAAWPLAARAQQADGRAAALLLRILQLQANGTAAKIEQFIIEIESQVGWTTQLPWSVGTMDQRRFDALRLLRQVPAVTELSFLDASGTEQLKVSRLAMDVMGSKSDLSQDPKFTEAVAHKVYFGPVYLRRSGDIHMTLSLAGTRRESGVSVAEVALKLVWDIIWQLKVGEHGAAYVLDAQDRVIAHSAMFTSRVDGERDPFSYHVDVSLFQRDLSGLAQVQAARAAGSGPTEVRAARDINGRDVLCASASGGPGWHVFVELPLAEAETAVP
jgi:hypothetical protein